MKTRVLWLLSIALLTAMPALADPILEFNIPGLSLGTISFSLTGPNAGKLVGTGIRVDQVYGSDTPLHSGTVHNVLGGTLSFTTGNLISYSSTSYTFAAGGSISVSGVADLDDNGLGGGDSTTPLLTGVFTEEVSIIKLGGIFRLVSGAFFSTQDEVLAAYYGLEDISNWDGLFHMQFVTSQGFSGNAAAPFTSSTTLSGGISNTPPPIPEPGTLILGVSGLLGALLLAPRRRKRTQS